jgi:hypothetical protein
MDTSNDPLVLNTSCPIQLSTLETGDQPLDFLASDHVHQSTELELYRADLVSIPPLVHYPADGSSPAKKGKNHHHRFTTDAFTWNSAPAPLAARFATRKLALLAVRGKTGHKWKQENQSRNGISVRLRCHSHVNCESRIRVSQHSHTDPETQVIDEWHIVEIEKTGRHGNELPSELIRGIPEAQREWVDARIATHNGQAAKVYADYLTERWDGYGDAKILCPSLSCFQNRVKYLNRLNKAGVIVETQNDIDIFVASMFHPPTVAELEALPPTQAYVIGHLYDSHYGNIVVMTNNAVSMNILHEYESHDGSGKRIPKCMCIPN